MIPSAELETCRFLTTDGEIALINLESARRRSWNRFFDDPMREGLAEAVLENELQTVQFIGDVSALDRLEALAHKLAQLDVASARTALIRARVASLLHRFADARLHLAQARLAGASLSDVRRLEMTIDQACGVNLDGLLRELRQFANRSSCLEDLVALGGLLADLRDFIGADRVYQQALQVYRDVSPFPVAWVCFQLGVLWGELVPEPKTARAAHWYQSALECLPRYTRACIHLAEIYTSCGRANDALVLLTPAAASGDPEVHWRIADALAAQGKSGDAQAQMQAAHFAFELLLEKHLHAFADHGAEFYAGSGNDRARALELARINVDNRPTLRAFEQAYAFAVGADNRHAASELLADAIDRWGGTRAFRSSSLAEGRSEKRKGAAA
jgi:hypothetical protein